MDKGLLSNIVKWVLMGKPIESNGYLFTLKEHHKKSKSKSKPQYN